MSTPRSRRTSSPKKVKTSIDITTINLISAPNSPTKTSISSQMTDDVSKKQNIALPIASKTKTDSTKTTKPDIPTSIPPQTTDKRKDIIIKKDKKPTDMMLVEIEDTSMSLRNDYGAIGRFKCTEKDITLDIKGQCYDGHMFPCNTFFVVAIDETKVVLESDIHSIIRVNKVSSIIDSEKMISGDATLATSGDLDMDVNKPSSLSAIVNVQAGKKRKLSKKSTLAQKINKKLKET